VVPRIFPSTSPSLQSGHYYACAKVNGKQKCPRPPVDAHPGFPTGADVPKPGMQPSLGQADVGGDT